MQVVKVDGVVYLAEEVEGDVLEGAIAIDGEITQDITAQEAAEFVMTENLGELLTMTLGTHSAVVKRDLNTKEEVLIATAEANMEISRDMAIKAVENRYFRENF